MYRASVTYSFPFSPLLKGGKRRGGGGGEGVGRRERERETDRQTEGGGKRERDRETDREREIESEVKVCAHNNVASPHRDIPLMLPSILPLSPPP